MQVAVDWYSNGDMLWVGAAVAIQLLSGIVSGVLMILVFSHNTYMMNSGWWSSHWVSESPRSMAQRPRPTDECAPRPFWTDHPDLAGPVPGLVRARTCCHGRTGHAGAVLSCLLLCLARQAVLLSATDFWPTCLAFEAQAGAHHDLHELRDELRWLKTFAAFELIFEILPQSSLQTYAAVAYGSFEPGKGAPVYSVRGGNCSVHNA
jgi:hypothetical protein